MLDLLKDFSVSDTYDCGDNTVMYVIENAVKGDFERVCSEAEKSGYIKIDGNIIDTVIASTYRKDTLLHIYFSQPENKIRVINDAFSAEYKTRPEKSGNYANTLWQFEVDHSLIDCGMCYIIRCSDGSFFMIDSAHWYSVNDDIRIIDFLKKISGEEKPRIKGWFFSHAHEDHIGKFLDILNYYSSCLEIDTLYYNFPSPSHRDAPWELPFFNAMKAFRELVDEHKEINHVKLHTGMKFAVDNLEVTVLCTHEDVHPAPTQDFNNTSTVISVKAAASTVLFPGDASFYSDKVMISRYTDALRCDIVQVAHHGHSGTSPLFYKRAGAKCALFPVTVIKFDEEYDRQESNRTAIEIAAEYHIASNGTAEIHLPYEQGKTKILPDETFEDFDGIFNLWCYEYTPERKQQLYDEYLKRRG